MTTSAAVDGAARRSRVSEGLEARSERPATGYGEPEAELGEEKAFRPKTSGL